MIRGKRERFILSYCLEYKVLYTASKTQCKFVEAFNSAAKSERISKFRY